MLKTPVLPDAKLGFLDGLKRGIYMPRLLVENCLDLVVYDGTQCIQPLLGGGYAIMLEEPEAQKILQV